MSRNVFQDLYDTLVHANRQRLPTFAAEHQAFDEFKKLLGDASLGEFLAKVHELQNTEDS